MNVSMDKDVLVQLLDQWVKEMQNEIKNLHSCSTSLKQDVNKLKLMMETYSEQKISCNQSFTNIDERIKELEKKDFSISGDIEKNQGNLNSMVEKALLEKELQENKINTNKEELEKSNKIFEKQIDKVNTHITWQWRTILVMALGIIVKSLI